MAKPKEQLFTPSEGDCAKTISAKLLLSALRLAVPLMASTCPAPPPKPKEMSDFEALFYSSARGKHAAQEHEDFKRLFEESSKWVDPLATRAQHAVARKELFLQLNEVEERNCVLIVLQTLRAAKRNLEARRIANELELAIRSF